MNKLVLIAAVATCLVGGCASFNTTQYSKFDGVDTQRVAAIDHVARSRGVEVHWINYPQLKGIVSDPAAPVGT